MNKRNEIVVYCGKTGEYFTFCLDDNTDFAHVVYTISTFEDISHIHFNFVEKEDTIYSYCVKFKDEKEVLQILQILMDELYTQLDGLEIITKIMKYNVIGLQKACEKQANLLILEEAIHYFISNYGHRLPVK